MKKIIVFSDIHLNAASEENFEKSSQKLEKAILHLQSNHNDFDTLVFTGDLANSGKIEEYKALRNLISAINKPIKFMLGNHDNRDNFLNIFSDYQPDEDGFLQSCEAYEYFDFIFLDTLKDPYEDIPISCGYLCEKRLHWLSKRLKEAAQKKVILFMHHPAFTTGMQTMDRLRLKNSNDFFSIIKKFKNVDHLISGHIHRNITGLHDGYNFSTFKSINQQMVLKFKADRVEYASGENSGYGIILLDGKNYTIHNEEVY